MLTSPFSSLMAVRLRLINTNWWKQAPILRQSFFWPWQESNSARVDIQDDNGIFRKLIGFIYKQNLNLSIRDARKLWGLLYLAAKSCIYRLQTLVEYELGNHIKRTTVGDPFMKLIMDQIELHSELQMNSEEFLELRKKSKGTDDI